MKTGLFGILMSFILGILLSEYRNLSPNLWVLLVPVLLCVLPFLGRPFHKHLLLLIIFSGLGALGHSHMINGIPADHLRWQIDPEKKAILTGRVISHPEVFPDKTRLLLRAESFDGRTVSGLVQVHVYSPSRASSGKEDSLYLDYGDHLEIRGKFKSPRNAGNPGAFDYVSFLGRKGIRVVGAASEQNIRVMEKGTGNRFLAAIARQKSLFHIFVGASLPKVESSMVKAVITGDRGGISPETREFFIRAGAAHLLAISGLHMGFVAFFCYQFFLTVFRFAMPQVLLRHSYFWTVPARLASVITFFLMPIYTILAGGRTSSVRAAIMIMVFLGAKILERERDLFQTLSLAALILLAWRPCSLFEVDFQLSFAAVTAIVLYLQHSGKTGEDRDSEPRENPAAAAGGMMKRALMKVTQLLLISVLATAGTAPITAAVFHRVSMVGVAANLFLVPLTGLWIVPFGLAAFSLFVIYPPLALWPAKLAGAGSSLLVSGVGLFGSLDWAAPWVFAPSGYWVALYYFLFLFLMILPRLGPIRRVGGILVLSLFFYIGNGWAGRIKADDLLHVRFLDVGQGASTLMVLPDAKTVLIDGGGSYLLSHDVGRKVLLPALLSQGIKRIDIMILTHPHPDHLNGLIGLLEEIPVGEVWDGWEFYPSETYHRFRQLLSERGIPRRFLNREGEKIRIAGVLFEVLRHGAGATRMPDSNINNQSVVLRVTFEEIGILLTGDLEARGEGDLVKRYGTGLETAVLQVPHHGSLSSSSTLFVDAVRPEIAVVQVGAHNSFGLPSSEVLGRYRYIAPQKRLFRTDRNGAVWLRTDGKVIQARTFEDLTGRVPDGPEE